MQHGERTRRKPGSEECGAFRGAARREKRRKPGSEECGAFRGAARRERSGESPAVRNAEHSEVQHGERTWRKPGSEECGAYLGERREQ